MSRPNSTLKGSGRFHKAALKLTFSCVYVIGVAIICAAMAHAQATGVEGDYDGDGKADVAVWLPSVGDGHIVSSATGSPLTTQYLGLPGDIPVPGNYDGNGTTDIAVWRPTVGGWYIQSNVTTNVSSQYLGLSGDIPVPGNYDGNGTTDIAVWRPSVGGWYIQSNVTSTVGVQYLGLSGDVPVPGNYDGNGKTDLAVWRPSVGGWYIQSNVTSTVSVQYLGLCGRYFAYYLSSRGSDWQEGHVLEIETGNVLEDHLEWLKVTGLAWFRDGFFYSRYDAPEDGHDLSSRNEGHQVYYHRLGTAQSDDRLVYEDKTYPQRFHTVDTTEDERFAILTVSERGEGKDGNALFFSTSPSKRHFTPIVAEVTHDRFQVIDNIGDEFLIFTNQNAPNGRVALYHPLEAAWKDVIPETTDTLSSVATQGGKLFVTYARDVTSQPYVYSLEGKIENAIVLPGPGTAGGFGGRSDDTSAFYAYSSFNYPSTIFRYDIAARESSIFRESAIKGFQPRTTKRCKSSTPAKTAPDPHVSCLQTWVEARWKQSHAALRVWRLQRHRPSRVQSAASGTAGAGIRLCFGQPAGGQRIRRKVAPGRNEAAKAKCL